MNDVHNLSSSALPLNIFRNGTYFTGEEKKT